MSEVLYGPVWPLGTPRRQRAVGLVGGLVLGAALWGLGDPTYAITVLVLGLLMGSFLARSAYRLDLLPEGVVRTRGGRSELWRWEEVRSVSVESVPYRSERLEVELGPRGGRSRSFGIELDEITPELKEVLAAALAPCRDRGVVGESASRLLWGPSR